MNSQDKEIIKIHRHTVGILKGLKKRVEAVNECSEKEHSVKIAEQLIEITYRRYEADCKALNLKPKKLEDIKVIHAGE